MASALASVDVHEQVAASFPRDAFGEDAVGTMPIEVPIYQDVALCTSRNPLSRSIVLGKDVFFQVPANLVDRSSAQCDLGFI